MDNQPETPSCNFKSTDLHHNKVLNLSRIFSAGLQWINSRIMFILRVECDQYHSSLASHFMPWKQSLCKTKQSRFPATGAPNGASLPTHLDYVWNGDSNTSDCLKLQTKET